MGEGKRELGGTYEGHHDQAEHGWPSLSQGISSVLSCLVVSCVLCNPASKG